MILYLDTSALVKVFVDEPGRAEVAEAVGRSSAIATAMVSYAEARATFARLLREERLTAREHSDVVEQLDMRWRSYERPPVTNELVGAAGDLAERLALRGYDAVQLASAAACYTRRDRNDLNDVPRAVRFMAFDGDLNTAARNVLPLYDADENLTEDSL